MEQSQKQKSQYVAYMKDSQKMQEKLSEEQKKKIIQEAIIKCLKEEANENHKDFFHIVPPVLIRPKL